MDKIGKIGNRTIYYVQVRNNANWKISLPNKGWIAFTIANKEDGELVPSMVSTCINKNVAYTCSSGEYASMTEDFFDEESVFRAIDNENSDDNMLSTSSHQDFEEGFWFTAVVADVEDYEIEKVVCIDLTKRKVENQLIDLVEKINSGWLPP